MLSKWATSARKPLVLPPTCLAVGNWTTERPKHRGGYRQGRGRCDARGVLNPEYLARLRHVRRALYDGLGLRQDSLFDLLDAVLSAPGPVPLVPLSLCPAFRRRWPSTCDALSDGTLDVPALRALLLAHLPASTDARPVWGGDGTVWPRPAAATSPQRTSEHAPSDGVPQTTIVAGWASQWLVAVPEPSVGGSWALPLDVDRRGPTAATPTQAAIAQVRRARHTQRTLDPASPRPVVALDSGHDPSQLAVADLDADVVVRLAKHRVFRRAPGPYRGRGAPAKHGPPFRLKDPATHGAPDRTARTEHPAYGTVTVDAWMGLHAEDGAAGVFTVVRVQVEHLPRHAAPQPLWLAWVGGPLPDDLLDIWHWYLARFTVEHLFRLLKQTLGWTTPRLRHPAAADRWTWLLALAVWQLWLARPLVADRRLPWERPCPSAPLTPGRVRRAFAGLLPALGSPARAPQLRGKSPGRPVGLRPGPARRFAVERRVHPAAA